MSRYQHKKGQIKDNAIEALLHDPLFRQRVEKNKKGKGSYLRKGKHGNRGNWEASGKKVNHFFTTGLLLIKNGYFVLSADRGFRPITLPLLRRRWRSCRLFCFFTVESVDKLNGNKDSKGHNHKIKYVLDKHAVMHDDRRNISLRFA